MQLPHSEQSSARRGYTTPDKRRLSWTLTPTWAPSHLIFLLDLNCSSQLHLYLPSPGGPGGPLILSAKTDARLHVWMRPHLPPAANLGFSPKDPRAENCIISGVVKNLFICPFFSFFYSYSLSTKLVRCCGKLWVNYISFFINWTKRTNSITGF